jgi:putative CocE/NonD family hydrolase
VEKREDVLVYTSAPLQSPVEVVGRIRLHLAGASTAPVTDWVARLCDVDADGVSRNITDGILRTSTSTSEGEDTRSNEAEHEIDLWSTAHVFLPGHRIRLQVTASCFPRWDVGSEAQQTVHHDTDRPSRLVLPVSTL